MLARGLSQIRYMHVVVQERGLWHRNIFRDNPGMFEKPQVMRHYRRNSRNPPPGTTFKSAVLKLMGLPKPNVFKAKKTAKKPRTGFKYNTLHGCSFLAADVTCRFGIFINKQAQEILNPAELCQGGYQGTDSSSFSQNSEGLGVKSQGSAPPPPPVAWVESRIICEWQDRKLAQNIHLKAQPLRA